MKTCSWCGVLKQFIFFAKNKNSTDGYSHMCDSCRKLREWRKPSK